MPLVKKILQIEISDFVAAVVVGLWFWWLTDVFELMKLEWFKSIPAAIWASIITLTGVIITIRNGNTQKDRERNMALRREIYLDATAAITQWKSLIGSLCNLDTPQSQLDEELRKISPALSKVSVIATNETVKTTSQLTSQLLEVYLSLLSERISLMDRKIEIEIINNEVQQCLSKQQYNLQIMEHVNLESDVFRQKTFQVAQNNFNFWTKKLEENFQKRDELQKEQFEEHMIFIQSFHAKLCYLEHPASLALFSIRKEMEIPIDEQKYRQTLDELSRNNRDSLRSFLNKLKDHFSLLSNQK